MSWLKETAKSGISMIIGKSIDNLVVNTDFVSFDIFDTLILRKCGKPGMIFYLIDEIYAGFAEQRTTAEYNARKLSDKEEITLDEIYSLLENIYGKEQTEKLKELEIKTELSQCVPNHEMLRYYNELLSDGKRIFLISDMYLPSDVIRQILEKCGIRGYEKLYVSSEYRKTKRSGSLFDLVLSEQSLKPENLTHIGDHPLADYLIPGRKRIHTFLYKKMTK